MTRRVSDPGDSCIREKIAPGNIVLLPAVPDRAGVGVGHRRHIDIALFNGGSRDCLRSEGKSSDRDGDELREGDHGRRRHRGRKMWVVGCKVWKPEVG